MVQRKSNAEAPQDGDRIFGLREASAEVGISYQTLWRAMRDGDLKPPPNIVPPISGARYFVRASDLYEFVRNYRDGRKAQVAGQH